MAQQHGDRITFSRERLLSFRFLSEGKIPTLHPDNRSLRWPSQQKRGRRGGTCCRVKRLCLDNRRRLPPSPSVFLSNAQSLRHKTDELEIWQSLKVKLKNAAFLP